jgi:hypothetical protein
MVVSDENEYHSVRQCMTTVELDANDAQDASVVATYTSGGNDARTDHCITS